MSYSIEEKEHIKLELYQKVKVETPTIELDDIIAYHDDVLYRVYNSRYIDTLYVKSEYNGHIIFKEFEKKSYICTETEVLDANDNIKFVENVRVDILYIVNDMCNGSAVFFYINEYNDFQFGYYSQIEFDNTFIPDYTNENLKLIDGL